MGTHSVMSEAANAKTVLATSPDSLKVALESVLQRHFQEPVAVAGLVQLTAGAAAQTWRFEVQKISGNQLLILRRGKDEDQFAGALSKADEAAVIVAAVAAGVPAPRIVLALAPEHGLGEGFIMECLEGETLPQRILRDTRYAQAREVLAAHCGRALAAIHSVPVASVSHLPVADALSQIAFYERSYRDFAQPLPVFDLAFQHLRQRAPQDEFLTLVHGDFRNGNLMVGEEGLRSVLDWELSHIGDPMEDLGWLCVNSWRFGHSDKPVGGFGDRQPLFEAYAKAANIAEVDADRVAFWELFGVVKWGVICLYQSWVHLSGTQRSVERAAIGRRVSECELDIVELLKAAR